MPSDAAEPLLTEARQILHLDDGQLNRVRSELEQFMAMQKAGGTEF